MGAYGGRRDLMEQLAPAGPVYQAGTLSGNPLTPDLYARLDALGARLAGAAGDAGVDLQVNRLGSVLTPFFTAAPVCDYDGTAAADTAAYARFFRGMLARGAIRPRRSSRVSTRPPK